MHITVTPWTDKEVATALQLYSGGHTFTDIAQTLRRTRGEVAGKLFRLRRDGAIEGRLVKERPPARERPPRVRVRPPRPPPIKRKPQVATAPPKKFSPRPPSYQPPPQPVGPPTLWEMDYDDCRFPVGRRDSNGPMVFCAKEVTPGSSWCSDHRAIVYARRP